MTTDQAVETADLEAIEARLNATIATITGAGGTSESLFALLKDVPALLAEVKRLRADYTTITEAVASANEDIDSSDPLAVLEEVRALQRDSSTLADLTGIMNSYWRGSYADPDRALKEIAEACGMDVSDWDKHRSRMR